MTINFLDFYNHVLPKNDDGSGSEAFKLTRDTTHEKLYEGLAAFPQSWKDAADALYFDMFPETTRALDEWSQAWDLWPRSRTEQEIRDALTAAWQDTGGQSPRYLQDRLRAHGFDVYVHDWWGDVLPKDTARFEFDERCYYINGLFPGTSNFVEGRTGRAFKDVGTELREYLPGVIRDGGTGLLTEPSRTNHIKSPINFASDDWELLGSSTISNNTTDPFGANNAYRWAPATVGDNGSIRQITTSPAANKTYTFSMWMRGTGTVKIGLSNNIDDNINQTITLTNDWVRVTLTKSFNASVHPVIFDMQSRPADTATSVDIYGAQLEEGDFVTSFIPFADGIIDGTNSAVRSIRCDTRKDDIADDWRFDSTKSWYTETLNTSTRGRKQEFPQVIDAVLIGTLLTIYDATEPDHPMWMTANITASSSMLTGSAVQDIKFLNGSLYLGAATDTNGGLTIMDFIEDRSYLLRSGTRFKSTGGVSTRNTNTYVADTTYGLIVNTQINSVAVTRRSGATYDTIAVGTNSGVSVINPLGTAVGRATVYDITSTQDNIGSIAFTDDDRIICSSGAGTTDRAVLNAFDIPTSDQSGGFTPGGSVSGGAVYGAVTISGSNIDIFQGSAGNHNILGADKLSGNTIVIGREDDGATAFPGVTLVSEDATTPANGMAAYITTDVSTGWMRGDIRGSWINGTTTGNLVGGTVPDRSVKANDLTVNGTLTRTVVATGAELVEVGGYGGANYLERAYDADYDYGTGNFHIVGWFTENANAVLEVIMSRRYWTGAAWSGGGQWWVFILPNGNLRFEMSDDDDATRDAVESTFAVDDGQHHSFAVVRDGSTLRLYIDGIQNATSTIVNATGSLNNSSATLRLGQGHSSNQALNFGKLALMRTAVGAPSATQVSKMHADELLMFQEGAQVTLDGTSDDVRSVSYDSKLGAGTADGVTRFNSVFVRDTYYDVDNSPLTIDSITTVDVFGDDLLISSANETALITQDKIRDDDSVSLPTSVLPATTDEYSVVARVIYNGKDSSEPYALSFNDGDNTSNESGVYINNSNEPTMRVNSGGVNQVELSSGQTITPGTAFNVAMRNKANDFGISVGGADAVTDTSGLLPVGVDTLRLGRRDNTGQPNGAFVIESFEYVPRAFTDAELKTASTNGPADCPTVGECEINVFETDIRPFVGECGESIAACGETTVECGNEVIIGIDTYPLIRNPKCVIDDGSGAIFKGECGDPKVLCGAGIQCGDSIIPEGFLLVNKISEATTGEATNISCGEPGAECLEPLMLCGQPSGFKFVERQYTIPNDLFKWPEFVYVGGQTWPEKAQIPAERRDEFETTIIKLFPNEKWVGLLVEYT